MNSISGLGPIWNDPHSQAPQGMNKKIEFAEEIMAQASVIMVDLQLNDARGVMPNFPALQHAYQQLVQSNPQTFQQNLQQFDERLFEFIGQVNNTISSNPQLAHVLENMKNALEELYNQFKNA